MSKLSFTMILLAIIYMVSSRSTMNDGNEMSLSIEAKAYDHKSDTGIEGSLHLNNGQKSASGEDNSEDDTSEDGNTKGVELCLSGVSNSSIIRNNQITASSYWKNRENHAPYHARLFGSSSSSGSSSGSSGIGCWAANFSQANEWIQVDYEQTKTVVGVITQGRDDYRYPQWVTSFNILYRAEGSGSFEPIHNGITGEAKVFQGNTDMNTPVTNYFGYPITARYFRINVLTWNAHISLRFDFLLC